MRAIKQFGVSKYLILRVPADLINKPFEDLSTAITSSEELRKRKEIFHQRLKERTHTNYEVTFYFSFIHQQFIKKNKISAKVTEILTTWHVSYPLEQVPDIETAPLPAFDTKGTAPPSPKIEIKAKPEIQKKSQKKEEKEVKTDAKISNVSEKTLKKVEGGHT